MHLRTSSLYATIAAIAIGVAGLSGIPQAQAGGKAMPAQANTHGKSLSEWLKLYFKWAVGGGDESGPKVDFLPLPAGEPTGEGAGTADDPLVLEGSLDVALNPGVAFVLPISAATRERYEDGSIDAIYPDSIFADSEYSVILDGKRILEKAPGGLSPYYVFSQEYVPPVEYAEPTSYGSVATHWVQGYCFVSPPLQPGTHVLKLHSTIIIAGWDFGLQFENTWTITVPATH